MPKRAVFERSRRELSLDVSVGVHILLVVEQSILERRSRGCAKTPITVLGIPPEFRGGVHLFVVSVLQFFTNTLNVKNNDNTN